MVSTCRMVSPACVAASRCLIKEVVAGFVCALVVTTLAVPAAGDIILTVDSNAGTLSTDGSTFTASLQWHGVTVTAGGVSADGAREYLVHGDFTVSTGETVTGVLGSLARPQRPVRLIVGGDAILAGTLNFGASGRDGRAGGGVGGPGGSGGARTGSGGSGNDGGGSSRLGDGGSAGTGGSWSSGGGDGSAGGSAGRGSSGRDGGLGRIGISGLGGGAGGQGFGNIQQAAAGGVGGDYGRGGHGPRSSTAESLGRERPCHPNSQGLVHAPRAVQACSSRPEHRGMHDQEGGVRKPPISFGISWHDPGVRG